MEKLSLINPLLNCKKKDILLGWEIRFLSTLVLRGEGERGGRKKDEGLLNVLCTEVDDKCFCAKRRSIRIRPWRLPCTVAMNSRCKWTCYGHIYSSRSAIGKWARSFFLRLQRISKFTEHQLLSTHTPTWNLDYWERYQTPATEREGISHRSWNDSWLLVQIALPPRRDR